MFGTAFKRHSFLFRLWEWFQKNATKEGNINFVPKQYKIWNQFIVTDKISRLAILVISKALNFIIFLSKSLDALSWDTCIKHLLTSPMQN